MTEQEEAIQILVEELRALVKRTLSTESTFESKATLSAIGTRKQIQKRACELIETLIEEEYNKDIAVDTIAVVAVQLKSNKVTVRMCSESGY